jgi:hypothetical protein
MLSMEQVYRIRNMKKFEGKSLRKISEITGHVNSEAQYNI